jgi:hypothetical protein
LRGEIPGTGQILHIAWNDRVTALQAMPEGRFDVTFDTPRAARGQPLHLEIRAEKSYQRQRRYHGGFQELCYRLDSATLHAEGGDWECRPPRRLIPVPAPAG